MSSALSRFATTVRRTGNPFFLSRGRSVFSLSLLRLRCLRDQLLITAFILSRPHFSPFRFRRPPRDRAGTTLQICNSDSGTTPHQSRGWCSSDCRRILQVLVVGNHANSISQPRNVGTGSTFRGFVLHIFLSGSAGITRWREGGIRGRALPQQSILLPFANLYIGIQMRSSSSFSKVIIS